MIKRKEEWKKEGKRLKNRINGLEERVVNGMQDETEWRKEMESRLEPLKIQERRKEERREVEEIKKIWKY